MSKGLLVEIYRAANFPDCTNDGISSLGCYLKPEYSTLARY
jgi:hypothetical protein